MCSASCSDYVDAWEAVSLKIVSFAREIYARFSIPSTGIILFTAGLEVEASAARASADVLSPLGIFVSSNLSNC